MGEGLFPTIHDKCSELGDGVRRLESINAELVTALEEIAMVCEGLFDKDDTSVWVWNKARDVLAKAKANGATP